MSNRQSYAVIGLGRYGSAVAGELVAAGADVLAVDINRETVDSYAGLFPLCKCADTTEPEAIRQLGISNVDVVIIAMASNLEASVMTTMLCKEAGVQTVIVKCGNEMHQKILLRVGADQVVFPETESGKRLAKNLLSSGFMDIMDLSKDVSMLELSVRPEWVGETLANLRLRSKYSINVVAIYQNGTVTTDIDPAKPLDSTMKLIVIANTAKLNRLK